MKAYTNPDGTHTIHISSTNGESAPTGTVEGNIDVAQGDNCVDDDTQVVKVFNGSSWVSWS